MFSDKIGKNNFLLLIKILYIRQCKSVLVTELRDFKITVTL